MVIKMEKLVQYLNFYHKSSLKKARRLLDNGVEPEAIVIHDKITSAIVNNRSVCFDEDCFSCGCPAGMAGQNLCYHIIFLLLYMKENDYEIPHEIIEGMKKYVESRLRN